MPTFHLAEFCWAVMDWLNAHPGLYIVLLLSSLIAAFRLIVRANEQRRLQAWETRARTHRATAQARADLFKAIKGGRDYPPAA